MDTLRGLMRKSLLAVIPVFAAFGVLSAASAQVNIRVGHGSAAEETLWLMKADPKVTPSQGKAYKLDYTPVPRH